MPKASRAFTTPPTCDGSAYRHDLAGAFGALMLLVLFASGAAKATEHDGLLIELCDDYVGQWSAARDAWEHAGVAERRRISSVTVEAMVHGRSSDDQAWRIAAEISRIPARTPEGMQAKARVVRCWLHDCGAELKPRFAADAYTAAALSLVTDVLGRVSA